MFSLPSRSSESQLSLLETVIDQKVEEVVKRLFLSDVEYFTNLLRENLKGSHALIDKSEVLLSVQETLQLTKPPIGRTTLYLWTKAKKIKAYKIGKRVLYSKEEVLKFLTSVVKKPA